MGNTKAAPKEQSVINDLLMQICDMLEGYGRLTRDVEYVIGRIESPGISDAKAEAKESPGGSIVGVLAHILDNMSENNEILTKHVNKLNELI